MSRKTPSSTSPHAGYVSLSEAADMLGLSTRTLRRRIADGSLRATRVGPKVIRVNADDLEALLRPVGAASWIA